MDTEGNVTTSADDAHDDLTAINGIGPAFAKTLYEIGIRRFADLAQYTPAELSKMLLEQAGKRVPSERIEANDWIGQARTLAEAMDVEITPPEEEEAEVVEEPKEVSNHPTWRQHAGFSIFFDYVIDEQGGQVWQTRVYHDESDEKTQFPGIETDLCVNWILEQAKLPVAQELIPTETTGIEILDVQVSETEPSFGVQEDRLMAEIRFQISGTRVKALAADRIRYQIEIQTVNLESDASNLVASEQSHLQPEVFEYTSQHEFPMPDSGRYELQGSVVLMPPSGKISAFYRGSTFRVVP